MTKVHVEKELILYKTSSNYFFENMHFKSVLDWKLVTLTLRTNGQVRL